MSEGVTRQATGISEVHRTIFSLPELSVLSRHF